MTFEFATAGRILFGEGRAREVGGIVASLGRNALVVRGGGDHSDFLLPLLHSEGVEMLDLRVRGEPSVELVDRAVEQARSAGCQVVVALGGGSVMDAGKAIAALLTNPGEARDYLEVVGSGRPLLERAAPVVAIPTTAGTGAEVTRNAVLAVPQERVKVSLRSPSMLPAVAVVDPELTYALPPEITSSTGLDALTQCIEPYVSTEANPLTDAIAREGIERVAGALRRACHEGGDEAARRDMAIASLFGGLALANARLGAVHGLAGPLGGMFPVPHGVACARLLAPVMRANIRALRFRAARSPALVRYADVARVLTGRADAQPEAGAEWVAALVAELRVPPLAGYGVADEDIELLVSKAERASSMKGNPIALTAGELAEILRAG